MRITRGSNFHDEEQQLGAQSGVKQGSLKRRGSGFVSTVTPLSSLPVYPRVLEESLFSMTIEFRCAKVQRNRSREIDSRPISNLLPPPSLRRNLQIPRVFPLPSPLLCVLRYQGGSGDARCFPKIPLVFGEAGSRKTPLPRRETFSKSRSIEV